MADLDDDAGEGPSPELTAALERLIEGTPMLSHKIGTLTDRAAASPIHTYHALASAVAICADALVDLLNEEADAELPVAPSMLMRDAMLPAAEVLELAASKFRESHVLLVKRIGERKAN